MPVVVANIKPKSGQMDAVEAVLKELIPAVHSEDGCELYALHRSKDSLVMIEKWRDSESLGVHGGGENMKALMSKLAGLVDSGGGIQVIEAVPAGESGKGAL